MPRKAATPAPERASDVPAAEDAAVPPSEGAPQQEPLVEEPKPTVQHTLPSERRCPTHARFFPEEPDVRPISEFRINHKTGRLAQTYCVACQSKLAKERRLHAKDSADSLEQQIAAAQARLDALKARLEAVVTQAEADAEADAEEA